MKDFFGQNLKVKNSTFTLAEANTYHAINNFKQSDKQRIDNSSTLSNTSQTNLPVQLTSFIGREKEIDQAKQLLSTTHLLTLAGAGGVGKTRLALQLGAALLESFKDGVWLVELAPISDPSLVAQAIAQVMELRAEMMITPSVFLFSFNSFNTVSPLPPGRVMSSRMQS